MPSEKRNHVDQAAGDTKPLPDILNRRMAAYVLAAGAASIPMAAQAPPGESQSGQIVVTPMHVFLGNLGNTHFSIDVNQDGVTDFFATLTNHLTIGTGYAFAGGQLCVRPQPGNAAMPKALIPNTLIGSSGAFNTSLEILAWGRLTAHSGHSGYYSGGPWKGATNHFLGVRFLINGETHYGWIRMTVTASPEEVTDYITGYGYNTVANQPLRAGLGFKKATRAGFAPATLGALSLGAAGLVLWRKKEESS